VTLDALNDGLHAFAGSTDGYPFGPGARVYKVGGKMFAIVSEDETPVRVSLKCDPEIAEELREQYPDAVIPGYHLSKRHWNTITADAVPAEDLQDWMEHSYDLVFRSLTRAAREQISADSADSDAA
jgi:predicted DNA-binding protein (MmcQ/YjbR family)